MGGTIYLCEKIIWLTISSLCWSVVFLVWNNVVGSGPIWKCSVEDWLEGRKGTRCEMSAVTYKAAPTDVVYVVQLLYFITVSFRVVSGSSGWGRVADCCECINEPPGFLIWGNSWIVEELLASKEGLLLHGGSYLVQATLSMNVEMRNCSWQIWWCSMIN